MRLGEQTTIYLSGDRTPSSLKVAGHTVNWEGIVLNGPESAGVEISVDAAVLNLSDTSWISLSGDDTRFSLTNGTGDPLTVHIAPGASVGARRISFSSPKAHSVDAEGVLFGEVIDFHLGEVDSISLSRVDGWLVTRLGFFGENGPGSTMVIDTLDVEGYSHLAVSGQMKSGGLLRIVSRGSFDQGDLIIEDRLPSQPTTIDSSGTVVLVAEQAFKNHASYEHVLFPGEGRVLIFSGTDTWGYNQGKLGYPEVYGVAYDPAALPSPAENTIYINQEEPAATVITITPQDITKIFDNKLPEIDPSEFTEYAGLQFRFDGGDGSGGINAGQYTIVPYGLSLSGARVLYDTATLTVEPRQILRCPDCIRYIQVLSKVYGDPDPDLSAYLDDLLSLAEGQTLSDIGATLTLPGKTAPVGYYNVSIVFDLSHEQAKNYILPGSSLLLGGLNVFKRPVEIRFKPVRLIAGFQELPEQIDFDLHNAPDFVSKSDFQPYVFVQMPQHMQVTPGTYSLEGHWYTRGGEAFLSNYDLSARGQVDVVVGDLQFMIDEGWKKAFPPPPPTRVCDVRGYVNSLQAQGAVQSQVIGMADIPDEWCSFQQAPVHPPALLPIF